MVGGPGNVTVTVCHPVVAFEGMVKLAVTCVALTCVELVAVIEPRVTLLIGADCGGAFTDELILIVNVNVVFRFAEVGETLVMP